MLHTQLTQAFAQAFLTAYPKLAEAEKPFIPEIVTSSQEKFGHYQCNEAMRVAKMLKCNPREVAEAVVAALQQLQAGKKDKEQSQSPSFISALQIAGPGFINITLDSDFLSRSLQAMAEDPRLAVPQPNKIERIVIDFSSPNIAKEMHVGHLRSTVIGDSLARLFEFLGHDVLRLNHLGDWGTSYGMLIAHMREMAQDVLQGQISADLTDLVAWYRASKKRFDEDPAFKKRAQLQVVALQGGDPIALSAWHIICRISEKAFREIYNLLQIKLEDRGESFYNPLLPKLLEDLEKKGLIVLSDGAKCMELEGFVNREGEPLPLILKKSDGGYNYATTDMAALRHRIDIEKADRIIYVFDAGQAQHIAMIFQAAEKAGYLDRSKVRVDYVPFGLVLGSDGKKFRTRSGETERLIDLLTAAIDKAATLLEERSPDMEERERLKIAKVLGLAAVKYSDLSCHRVSDYTFSYDRMLRFEGNTAAFMLYSYVRIGGIKRKVGIDIESIKGTARIKLQHGSEIALGLHLLRFPEVLCTMSEDLLPNRLCDYLYELAEKFNGFFRDCRVEGTAEQNERLLLCEVTANVMQRGLNLLGIETLERM